MHVVRKDLLMGDLNDSPLFIIFYLIKEEFYFILGTKFSYVTGYIPAGIKCMPEMHGIYAILFLLDSFIFFKIKMVFFRKM